MTKIFMKKYNVHKMILYTFTYYHTVMTSDTVLVTNYIRTNETIKINLKSYTLIILTII